MGQWLKNNALKREFSRISHFNLPETILKLCLLGLCTYSVSNKCFLQKCEISHHNPHKSDSLSWHSLIHRWELWMQKKSSCVRCREHLKAFKTQMARITFSPSPGSLTNVPSKCVTSKWPCSKTPAEWSEYNLNCLAIIFFFWFLYLVLAQAWHFHISDCHFKGPINI